MKLNCPYYNQKICLSCTEIEVDYGNQIKKKEGELTELLGVSPDNLLPTVTSSIEKFRAKAKFVITGSVDDPIIGLTGVENLDQGREILDCPLHDERINSILPSLKDFIQRAKLTPYGITSKKGEIKGIILFVSSSKEIYLRFILRSKESLDRIKKYIPSLQEENSDIKVISINIQPIPHAILEGEEEIFLTSESSVEHQFGSVRSEVHPQGFIQTNTEVAGKLYLKAAEWIRDISPEKFCELFSGQGAFSLSAAEYFRQGLGVEINPEAVDRANKTVKENHLSHLSFIAKDAGQVESEVKKFSPDALLVNPPRRGLGEALPMIQNLGVKDLIYSSCSAESLARDLKVLGNVYKIHRMQIFDMFPHTKHFETLVWLKRN